MQATSTVSPKESLVCQICDTSASKYVCPRCGIPYCSLACYKNETKHLKCSESFYRDCVVENIKAEESRNPESAKKMKEVLQRFHQEYNEQNEEEDGEELDSDDDEPLETRMAGVDLNDADEVWRHLSEDEKREFQKLVNNADNGGSIIPEWMPWWNEQPENKLVVEVSDLTKLEATKETFQKLHDKQPDILSPIPKMNDLTKVKPNEHVAKGLINVVAAYVWTARLFNGDMFDSEKIVEVASSIIYLSSFLKKDGLFKNMEHSVADVPMNALQVPELSEGGTAIQATLNRDIWIIIKGPNSNNSTSVSKTYLLSALTECHKVLLLASKTLKARCMKTKTEAEQPISSLEGSFSKLFPSPSPVFVVDVKLLEKAKRKLFYLLAFANEFTDTFLIS